MSLRALNYRACQTHGHSLHRDARCLECERANPTPPAPKPELPQRRSNALSSRHSEQRWYRFNNRARPTKAEEEGGTERGTGGVS